MGSERRCPMPDDQVAKIRREIAGHYYTSSELVWWHGVEQVAEFALGDLVMLLDRLAEHEARAAQPERTAPVQGYGRIPWSVHEKAWGVYAQQFGCDQSAERIAERHGFDVSEMDRFHPTWREEAEEIPRLRKQLATAREDGARRERERCLSIIAKLIAHCDRVAAEHSEADPSFAAQWDRASLMLESADVEITRRAEEPRE